MVSGFVLMGTGLALAGFGAWLAGNANCDAADLGRSCIAASLGVAVVGASLSAAGWLRLRRLEGDAAAEEGGGDLLARRPGLAMLAFMIVGLVLLAALLPAPQLPAAVYARGAPGGESAPALLLPGAVAGLNRTDNSSTDFADRVVATASYEGGVEVTVTRFNITNTSGLAFANGTWTDSRGAAVTVVTAEEAVRRADGEVNARYAEASGAGGARQCVRSGASHWFTQSSGSSSAFAWQAGNFVFEVKAPSQAARDRVAAALSA